MIISKRIRHVFSLLVLVVIITIINMNSPSDDELLCNSYRQLKFVVFEGIVVDKFLNIDQHNYPTIIINSGNGVQQLSFQHDQSGFYDYTQIGDKLDKSYGSYEVIIKRDSHISTLKLNYGVKCVEGSE